MNEELARRLRAAAEAHEPDRARILARVERGMSGAPARPHRAAGAWRWQGIALASVAAAGVLAVGGVAVASLVQTPPERPRISATHAAPSGPDASSGPSAPPSSGGPRTTPSAPATGGPTASAHPSPTGPAPGASGGADSARPGAHVQDGPLWSAGSLAANGNAYWTQSNITLRTTQPLTALTVELRVAQTGDVRSTGHWRTMPADDFSVTVRSEAGAVVYRWVLKPGRTVPTGQHVFAGQYNHAAGAREPARDGYRVDAAGAHGAFAVWGGFTPAP
ncbi:hypothetical protein ABZY31_10185 [Streptomyces sp. NPDC006529]|uniref:hypothetical protein n=1 Tax=Streptomyces sp. NPDC006529 TaxID=3157177 RepID=UPI0033B29ADB